MQKKKKPCKVCGKECFPWSGGKCQLCCARAAAKPKPRRKATGEAEVFREIWEEREHFCENLDCGVFLGDEARAGYFSHNKPKSTHPELRLDKTNIDLLCLKCHDGWRGSKSNYRLKNKP